MTAKEMFKKMGYKYDILDQDMEYSKVNKNIGVTYFIYFYLDEKTFACFTDDISYVNDINIQELKAIQKQLEELDWEK